MIKGLCSETCVARLSFNIGQVGYLDPLDPGPANGLPRWIQRDGFSIPSVLSI